MTSSNKIIFKSIMIGNISRLLILSLILTVSWSLLSIIQNNILKIDIWIAFLFIFYFISINIKYLISYLLSNVLIQKNRPIIRVIVYGAGSAGRGINSFLNHENEYEIVAFIDDDINLHNTILNGVRVFLKRQLKIKLKHLKLMNFGLLFHLLIMKKELKS